MSTTRAVRTAAITATGTIRNIMAARTSTVKIMSSIREHTGAATGKGNGDGDERVRR